MILQKLASAIRRQDWFQVVIEVLIVIVGIFLGLQVQAWYENQGERTLELRYLNQLHSDILNAEQNALTELGFRERLQSHLEDIRTQLQTTGIISEISEAQCNAIAGSHIYTNFINSISTIDEIESTGRSAIIRSDQIRNSLNQYKARKAGNDRITNQMLTTTNALAEKFPEFIELISFGGSVSIETKYGNQCHAKLMNESISFKNHLSGNTSKFNAYVGALKNQIDALQELHTAIDQELAITH